MGVATGILSWIYRLTNEEQAVEWRFLESMY